jgi:hypothetical protein
MDKVPDSTIMVHHRGMINDAPPPYFSPRANHALSRQQSSRTNVNKNGHRCRRVNNGDGPCPFSLKGGKNSFSGLIATDGHMNTRGKGPCQRREWPNGNSRNGGFAKPFITKLDFSPKPGVSQSVQGDHAMSACTHKDNRLHGGQIAHRNGFNTHWISSKAHG